MWLNLRIVFYIRDEDECKKDYYGDFQEERENYCF